MAKKCTVEGCTYPVFGKGYCKMHQYHRDDIKKSIRPRKKEKKNPWGFNNQNELFAHVWENQKDEHGRHFCWLTGVQLDLYYNTTLYYSLFAHVLRKGHWTKWKFNPDNIRLLHPNVHMAVDNFKEELRGPGVTVMGQKKTIDFDRWFSLQDELKAEYERLND